MSGIERRIPQLVEAYDALGIHRTGSAVDETGATWLRARLADAGLEAQCEELPFAALDIQEAQMEIDGLVITGVPLFDGTDTEPDGLTGALGPLGTNTPLGFGTIDPNGQGLREIRASCEHRGLILIPGPDAPRPGLSLANAPDYENPWGPPVLQVSNEHQELLADVAGREARLTITTRRRPTRAKNVVATIEGRSPDLAPVVVMTPRSSWWHSTAERAGGLVVWLEMARAVAARPRERTVHFLASTGHELGHLGLEHYLRSRAALVFGARLWIHLGANFTAASGSRIITQASDAALETLLARTMERAGVAEDIRWPVGTRPLGEAANVFDGAGHYLSLLGGQDLFHHQDDRWPHNVDLPRLTRIVRAFNELSEELVDATSGA